MEIWEVLDKEGNAIGKTIQRGEDLPKGEYHLVVFGWIKNRNGEYIISRRSENKTHALLWECTGGSAVIGEDSLTAIIREVKEEIGITVHPQYGKKLMRVTYESNCSYIVDVWLFEEEFSVADVRLQEEEVCEVKIVTKEEIIKRVNEGNFVPSKWIEQCLSLL